ncbi:rhodanese-like domain-containing protein [Vibrio sp. T187]|uniref:rhodanese-like domain-containing protein n=1 Tax=Vibrio TaxID=662 RepID=UPI0010C964CB|nr:MULTISPECIES: rhodanese-like domain-containing protein [Vibrio]MBW3696656.1 rhodanese-like domain-containing protein [Vibrio sp. T187]
MSIVNRLEAVLMTLLVLIFSSMSVASERFPYRSAFSDVPVIEVEQLRKQYDDVVIIDVRSKLEYDVIHISKAINVTMSNLGFEEKAKNLAKKGSKLVVYCNGHDCKKSYQAARRLMKDGLNDVYAFDAGVLDWVNAYPEMTVLLDETPVDLNKLISADEFKAKLINKAVFLEKAKQSNSMPIDVRENFQRVESGKQVVNFRSVPVDKFHQWLQRGNGKDNTLLIVDAVGKQVRWLQYYLIKYEYQNYYFLEGGIGNLQ